VCLTVNGETYERLVSPTTLLADFLREDLLLTGTKVACGTGDCSACSVMLDGEVVLSCLILAVEADGRCLRTVEGLVCEGEPSPVQQALIESGGVQCGFCTPGIVVTAQALLERCPHPSQEQIRDELAGNVCRCTGYRKIIEAVAQAAREGRP
jgi:carbon-monoxide dehydrogenase small subunit